MLNNVKETRRIKIVRRIKRNNNNNNRQLFFFILSLLLRLSAFCVCALFIVTLQKFVFESSFLFPFCYFHKLFFVSFLIVFVRVLNADLRNALAILCFSVHIFAKRFLCLSERQSLFLSVYGRIEMWDTHICARTHNRAAFRWKGSSFAICFALHRFLSISFRFAKPFL